jgi:hypothetical protein
MEDVFGVLIVASIVGFSIWFTILASKLNAALEDINNSEDQLDEIKEGIEIVATILNKLPELMPQFNMNTNPLQPIFEAFARKLSGTQPLMTYDNTGRDAEGKFDGTEKEQQEGPAS